MICFADVVRYQSAWRIFFFYIKSHWVTWCLGWGRTIRQRAWASPRWCSSSNWPTYQVVQLQQPCGLTHSPNMTSAALARALMKDHWAFHLISSLQHSAVLNCFSANSTFQPLTSAWWWCVLKIWWLLKPGPAPALTNTDEKGRRKNKTIYKTHNNSMSTAIWAHSYKGKKDEVSQQILLTLSSLLGQQLPWWWSWVTQREFSFVEGSIAVAARLTMLTRAPPCWRDGLLKTIPSDQ